MSVNNGARQTGFFITVRQRMPENVMRCCSLNDKFQILNLQFQ